MACNSGEIHSISICGLPYPKLKGAWQAIVGKLMLFYPAVHLTLNTATDPFSEALNSNSVADLQSFKTTKEKESEKLTY